MSNLDSMSAVLDRIALDAENFSDTVSEAELKRITGFSSKGNFDTAVNAMLVQAREDLGTAADDAERIEITQDFYFALKKVKLPFDHSLEDIEKEVVEEMRKNAGGYDFLTEEEEGKLNTTIALIQGTREALITYAGDQGFINEMQGALPDHLKGYGIVELRELLNDAERKVSRADLGAIEDISPVIAAIHKAQPNFFEVAGSKLQAAFSSFMKWSSTGADDGFTRGIDEVVESAGRGIGQILSMLGSSFKNASTNENSRGLWAGGIGIGAGLIGLFIAKRLPGIKNLFGQNIFGTAASVLLVFGVFMAGRKYASDALQGGSHIPGTVTGAMASIDSNGGNLQERNVFADSGAMDTAEGLEIWDGMKEELDPEVRAQMLERFPDDGTTSPAATAVISSAHSDVRNSHTPLGVLEAHERLDIMGLRSSKDTRPGVVPYTVVSLDGNKPQQPTAELALT